MFSECRQNDAWAALMCDFALANSERKTD